MLEIDEGSMRSQGRTLSLPVVRPPPFRIPINNYFRGPWGHSKRRDQALKNEVEVHDDITIQRQATFHQKMC